MTTAALLCAVLAFALLGLATDAHGSARLGSRLLATTKRRMRLAAWIALASSFPLAISSRGWTFGPVLWAGIVMLAAVAVFLLLNFAPPPERTRR